jgi:hypothetical protein
VLPSKVNLCSLSVAIISDYLSAHKALCDQDILHRDISPGNVMLTEAQNAPLRGFITDLEFARIESPTLLKPQRTVTINVGAQNICNDRGYVHSRTEPTTRTHTTFQSTVTVKRGAGMTVSYFDVNLFITLKEFNREPLNSWPGVSYCNQSVFPLDGPYTKLPMTSNPLSGCSLTPSCGISSFGLPNDQHRKRSGMSALPFETYLVKPSAKPPPRILLVRGRAGLLACFFQTTVVSTR